uniref:Putative secreted protein n=1 Tax=Ixodes ricinus TaxID=34613 RepID=A0A6B0UGX3_IXORI
MISGRLHSWLDLVLYFACPFAILFPLKIVRVSFASTVPELPARFGLIAEVVAPNSCSAWPVVLRIGTIQMPTFRLQKAAGQDDKAHHENKMHCSLELTCR